MKIDLTLRFANFEIADGELLRDGEAVHLQPQPMKVLTFLASRAGELVSRQELRDHVWPDTFVEADQSLNWCIRRIREALGDDANAPRFIQTLPRRGYRFIAAPVAERQRRPWLTFAAAAVAALLLGAQLVPSTQTVLVLPFDDLGTRAHRANDVATTEVINALARLDPHHLSVIDPLT
ncbi:MAG TPA: winged helix-turn-helix domain-containing protein, partial [Thermoanaerobaculia bacterium]|nr:winged helix-turn-helix domain-containing protein [Thermoanaerobaculia bacterium]